MSKKRPKDQLTQCPLCKGLKFDLRKHLLATHQRRCGKLDCEDPLYLEILNAVNAANHKVYAQRSADADLCRVRQVTQKVLTEDGRLPPVPPKSLESRLNADLDWSRRKPEPKQDQSWRRDEDDLSFLDKMGL